ncbi:MAG: hypothetical protein PWR06_1520 [Thermoanaerobacteraceae bacterium]|jgi:geranylgeranyl reductase family protein|nr:hypothetical protein [Thermoanaerobacter sp.]MDK2878804.1 hypothetical protein [Thermoanaerobacteraceae bacterium]MDN5311397.1 hypothetical protein [Thermoanaerobacteraceae bacterium]
MNCKAREKIFEGESLTYDAVIVGAGPSGAFCALNLAQKGFKVLIIDRCRFPREKVCGGLISQKSMNILGYDFLTGGINFNSINCICLRGESEEISMESKIPLGIVVKRKDFDQFLINRAIEAGAVFIDNCIFENCVLESGGYKIQTARGVFYADYLIGADGYYSKVARVSNIRNQWAWWERGIALSVQVPDKYIIQRRDNAVEFYFPDILAGLGWCFPGKGYCNVGVGGTAIDSKRIIGAFEHLLEWKIKDKTILSNLKFKAAFLPAGGRFRKISDRRIFLLGDAAGFVDAFSGEGIYYALRSAEILADVINQNKDGREYEKRCYETFLGEFRLSAFLSIYFGNKKNVFQKGLQDRFLKAFYMIMTQTPESMCYKKILHYLTTGGFSFDVPFLWLKRLILD